MRWSILLAVGCGQEYGVSAVAPPGVAPSGTQGVPAVFPKPPSASSFGAPAASPTGSPVGVPTAPPASAPTAWEAPVRSAAPDRDGFAAGISSPPPPWAAPTSLGSAPPPVDYLFVIDDSVSMAAVMDRVREGFAAMALADVFPPDSRIAVITTLPADRHHPVRPALESLPDWLGFEPGFLGVVDGPAIAQFRGVAPPEVAARFPVDGCDGWFAPGDTNAGGVPCLVAHTQTSLLPLGAEAGLTALGQHLSANPELFRPGAAVNVVFVSDTHDPGFDGPGSHALIQRRPSVEELRKAAQVSNDLASFRLHGIVPESECTVEKWSALGPVYLDAIRRSGGEALDLCAADTYDYVDLMARIALYGAEPQEVVAVLHQAEDVAEVRVNGRTAGFSPPTREGDRLVYAASLPVHPGALRVRYRSGRTPAQSTDEPAAR
ncbi:MAG: hypothetical protein ABMB14_22005 [Myxococcota bacterium]